MEPNPAHPDYERMIDEYNQDLELKVRRIMIKRGVVCEIDTEAVEEIRALYREELEHELDKSDKVVYVSMVAVGSEDDLNDLMNALTKRAQPTDLEVESAKNGFRS